MRSEKLCGLWSEWKSIRCLKQRDIPLMNDSISIRRSICVFRIESTEDPSSKTSTPYSDGHINLVDYNIGPDYMVTQKTVDYFLYFPGVALQRAATP